MKKRLGLLSLFGVTALLVALLAVMVGATSVLDAEPVGPPVLEVAAAEEGAGLGSLNLATVEAEGYAIAANGSMTTRADIGAFSNAQAFVQGFQHSLWSALGQLNSPFIYTAAVLLALTMTIIIITGLRDRRSTRTVDGDTEDDTLSVASGRMRPATGVC